MPVPDPHGKVFPERSAQASDVPPMESGSSPTPWVSASELQADEGEHRQRAMDEVDEMSMESFPASDPPSHSHRVRDDEVIPAGAPLETPGEVPRRGGKGLEERPKAKGQSRNKEGERGNARK